MGRLFHSLGTALENALAPRCFCCFLGRHWGCEDEIGWRTAGNALEGSEVLVPEGTEGLCHSYSCTQETGFCNQYAFQQVARLAQGEKKVMCSDLFV